MIALPKLQKVFIVELIDTLPVNDEKFEKELRRTAYTNLLMERAMALRNEWFGPEQIEKRTGLTTSLAEPPPPSPEGVKAPKPPAKPPML